MTLMEIHIFEFEAFTIFNCKWASGASVIDFFEAETSAASNN